MSERIGRGLWLAAIGHLIIELSASYLPVLYPLAMAEMGLNFTQVGLIALVATSAMALAQPLFGLVSDRWGPDRLSALSIVWIGVIMGFVGLANSFPLLLLLIGLGSLGSAAFHPSSAVLAAAHSGSRRGLGLSIFSMGGNIGAALSPLWIGMAFGAMGLPGTLTLVPLGLVGGALVFWQLRGMRRAEALEAAAAPQRPKPVAAEGFLVGLILIVVAMMFRSWFQVALTTYLPAWVEQGGGSLALGGRILAVLLIAVSVGSFVGGSAGDRFGHWQVVLVSTLVMPLGLWLFLHDTGVRQLFYLALIGVSLGCTFPTSIVLALESWPHQVGLASGLLMGLGWWPGGLGASFTGYLADRRSLDVALTALTLAPLVAFGCIALYALLNRRRMQRRKHEALQDAAGAAAG